MQADTEVESACTVAFENKVNVATVEIQSMKSVMQKVSEVVQAMQSMIMNNASAGLAIPGVC